MFFQNPVPAEDLLLIITLVTDEELLAPGVLNNVE
jgi:hypothetical protein